MSSITNIACLFIQHNLPLNCISHSRTESISIEFRSLKSSYSKSGLAVTLNVANPRLASRPPNAAYGPPLVIQYLH